MAINLASLTQQLGMSIWLFAVLMIWSLVWKAMALWKAAKKDHMVWFIVILLVNTIGIIPILYLYIFSEMGNKKKTQKKSKVKSKKR